MGILYNIVFIVFAFFYIPVFLFKRRKREGMYLRFGKYPKELIKRLSASKNIWIHAVSVGEVMAIEPLVRLIRQRHPGYRIVITTVTETGRHAAERLVSDNEIVLFLPFDISFIVRRAIRYIMPASLVIAETELWPNLIREAKAAGIKVFIVNARISDNSAGKYRLIKPILKSLFSKVEFICAQTQAQKERFESLGAEPSRIAVSGNMKFDSAFLKDLLLADKERLKQNLNISSKAKIFLAGSTHPGEEKMILDSYKELKRKFAGLRLIIAPRHIERAEEIEKLIRDFKLRPLCASKAPRPGSRLSGEEVLILDTIGRLKELYSIADIVFVGGSLINRGGQNMIEPAVFARPILTGSFTHNFRGVVELLKQRHGIIEVKGRNSLTEYAGRLLRDAETANNIGRNAKRAVESSRGAVERILKAIEDEKVFL